MLKLKKIEFIEFFDPKAKSLFLHILYNSPDVAYKIFFQNPSQEISFFSGLKSHQVY